MNKVIVCSICGNENSIDLETCEACGAQLEKSNIKTSEEKPVADDKKTKFDKNKSKKKKNNKDSKESGKKELSPKLMIYTTVILLAIALFILIASGTFDKPQPSTVVHQHTTPSSDDPHGGVDLSSLQRINQLETTVNNNPNNLEALLDLAHLLNDSGFYDKAITRYKEYLSKEPRNADVWVDMGVCYYELNQLEKAKEAMRKGIEIRPKHQIAHFNLGIVHLASQEIEKAKEYWRKTVELNSTTDIAKKAEELINSHL